MALSELIIHKNWLSLQLLQNSYCGTVGWSSKIYICLFTGKRLQLKVKNI